MDFRNFTTHAAERRRAGAILGTPPPVDGNGPACITAFSFQTVIIYTHNYEMRNPFAYVPIFFKLSDMLPVAYCQNLKTLFVPKILISNFHISVRARGVANFTGAAAFGGGVHPCTG